MNPRERASLVDALGSALSDGEHSLGVVPDLLRQLLQENAWRDFKTQLGDEVHYDRFGDFVTTPPLKGLGASLELIERIIGSDAEALRLFREAIKHQGERTDLTDNFRSNRTEVERGTTKAYTIERLSRERPDLYEQVQAGEKSANAAAIEAGWRKRSFAVSNPDDMGSVARTLRKNLDARQIDELIRLLTDDTND